MSSSSSLRRISNPPNPWHDAHVEWVGEPPEAVVEVFEDRSRSVLSRNTSPDVPFTWSVNPYRGCYHACAYCYARPTHNYLDFGAGTDFERKLTYKPDAAGLLRHAFGRRSWKGEQVAFSGVTDCYQPLEASLRLTRACLEVCLEYRNPASVVTKSTLVERDAELLAELSRESWAVVLVSIPFWNTVHARAVEPHVASPKRRIKIVRRLAEAGVPVGVNVSPIIPGLSDTDIPSILEAAREAGAEFVGHQMVRLPGPVREVFTQRIRATLPLRAERVLSQIGACRAGSDRSDRDRSLNDPRFGHRMRGKGHRWEAIESLFRSTARRLGFGRPPPIPEPSPFRRPGGAQLELL